MAVAVSLHWLRLIPIDKGIENIFQLRIQAQPLNGQAQEMIPNS